MRGVVRWAVWGMLGLLVAGVVGAEEAMRSAREIMERQEEMHRVGGERVDQVMMLVDAKGGKEKRRLRWYASDDGQGRYNSLAVFLAPAGVKGTALLTRGDEEGKKRQWLYMPAQGKMQRLAEAGRRTYFMGTDFTYEDMEPEDIDDYLYEVVGEETVEHGPQKMRYACYVIEAEPKDAGRRRESGYSKRRLWVEKTNLLTLTVEFYDRRGDLVKTQKAYEFENIGGTAWRAAKVIMDNRAKDHKTLSVVMSRQLGQEMGGEIFTERFITAERYAE